MMPRRLFPQTNVLPLLLLLWLFHFHLGVRASTTIGLDMDAALDAMYVDGSLVPTVTDTLNNFESGNRVRRSADSNSNDVGAMVVPKGFEFDAEREFADRRLNDKYYTFIPDLDKPRPQYGKGIVTLSFIMHNMSF